LLSDISDYEYDTLVEKPQSIGTCNNFEKSSSLSVSETSQFPENHHVLYSAVPLYDKRGLSFCTSGINTGQLLLTVELSLLGLPMFINGGGGIFRSSLTGSVTTLDLLISKTLT
jgi:hypothetical protein